MRKYDASLATERGIAGHQRHPPADRLESPHFARTLETLRKMEGGEQAASRRGGAAGGCRQLRVVMWPSGWTIWASWLRCAARSGWRSGWMARMSAATSG